MEDKTYIVQPYSRSGFMLPQNDQFSDLDAARRQAAYYRRRYGKTRVFDNLEDYERACQEDEKARAEHIKAWKEAERV